MHRPQPGRGRGSYGPGPGSRPDLAPQASAIAPFGVFSDLRWVSVYNNSWAALAAELAGVLVVRSALTALSIALAWPANLRPPGVGKLVRRSLFATALAAVLLSPSVTLLFGLAALPVSWLFLAAVPAALLVAFIIHPAAVSGDWWQRLVAPRAVACVALSFLVLSLEGAAINAAPVALWPVVAAFGGLFNAWSWVTLVHSVADRRPVRRSVPVAAIAALALVSAVVAGTVIGFGEARKAEVQALKARTTAAAEPAYGLSVLVVTGYGSSWSGAERTRSRGATWSSGSPTEASMPRACRSPTTVRTRPSRWRSWTACWCSRWPPSRRGPAGPST